MGSREGSSQDSVVEIFVGLENIGCGVLGVGGWGGTVETVDQQTVVRQLTLYVSFLAYTPLPIRALVFHHCLHVKT